MLCHLLLRGAPQVVRGFEDLLVASSYYEVVGMAIPIEVLFCLLGALAYSANVCFAIFPGSVF